MSRGQNWSTPCRGFSLRITAESWRQINSECGRADYIETGGVLVGHYSADGSMVFVTDALSPPKDSAQGKNWFHRGIAGLQTLFTKRWSDRVRSYYVGEWHYHPADTVEPSATDIAQMLSINADPRYCCLEPVLIIAGRSDIDGDRPCRAFVFPRGREYLEFTARN